MSSSLWTFQLRLCPPSFSSLVLESCINSHFQQRFAVAHANELQCEFPIYLKPIVAIATAGKVETSQQTQQPETIITGWDRSKFSCTRSLKKQTKKTFLSSLKVTLNYGRLSTSNWHARTLRPKLHTSACTSNEPDEQQRGQKVL